VPATREMDKVELRSGEEPVLLCESPDELMFAPRTLRLRALQRVQQIKHAPISEMIEILQRLAERDQQRPEHYLNLGLAYAVVGEWEKSIQRLQTAVNLYDDPTIMEQERQIDPRAEELQRQARYHLGRMLFEHQRELGKAVEELHKAKRQDSDDACVYFYLGQAIRALVERESLVDAADALQTYLDKGAPLGHENEIREFLKSRQVGTRQGAIS